MSRAARICKGLLPTLLGGAVFLASGAEIKFDFGQFQDSGFRRGSSAWFRDRASRAIGRSWMKRCPGSWPPS